MITAVIVYYVIPRSHICYANIILEQSLCAIYFICIIAKLALDLYSTSCRDMQN